MALALVVMLSAILVGGGYAAVRLGAAKGWTPGVLARWTAHGASVAFLLALLIYQKPQSFYTNFVIIPSLLFFMGGLCCVLLTVTLAIAAMIKGTAPRQALASIGLALAALAMTVLIISWRAH